MIPLLLALAASLAGTAGETRAHLARVQLEGPLERVRFVVEPMGETVVEGPLLAGESRALQIPLPLWAPPGSVEPEVVATGNGRAVFAGWVDPLGAGAERAWLALPAGLRARARLPDPEREPLRAPPLALLAVLAGFVLLLSQRRHPARAAAIGVASAVLTGALAFAGTPPPSRLRVLEGDAPSGRWIAVDGARGELALPAELPLRVESRPARARLVWRVPLAGVRGWLDGEARPTWILRGAGAALFAVSTFEPAQPVEGSRNAWGDFERAWVRDEAGAAWRQVGPWAFGRPLPEGGPGDPPGWLVAGLPQGPRVFAGLLDPDVGTGSPPRGGPSVAVWVRLTGFP